MNRTRPRGLSAAQKIPLVALVGLLGPLAANAADPPKKKTPRKPRKSVRIVTNHDPDFELKTFKTLPGFAVNLFAAEPMLGNPVHMTWDEKGRLWVVCSWSYPQVKPGETPNDKVIVLEDTDGDGRADKSTVFADKLYIPTGIELSNGGAYVAQAPDIVFLKDTDGDGVADLRRVELTGFGIEDSHHAISAWRRGPGGWIYFQEGIFLHSQVETQYGIVRLTNGGVFQYNPRTQRLRVFADCRVGNPWGHMFDAWGQSFLIDNPRVSYLSPLTANSRAKLGHQPLIKTEKQCGGDIISGRNFPPEMRGQILTCRFKSQTIVRYDIADAGSGYSAKLLAPLVTNSNTNFRPVDCKMGPDGALYICDWYNPVINHARHDFRDPNRNAPQGRIWRVRYTKRPTVERPQLAGAALPELLDHLKAPEYWTRHHVRLTVSQRDPEQVARALASWVRKLDANDKEFDRHRLEALWCHQNIGVVNETLLRGVLKAKTGQARAAAVRVLRYWHESVNGPLALLDAAVQDEFPRVRLEAVLTLSFLPDAKALPIALKALDKPMDRFLDHALKLTVDGLKGHWVPAMQAGRLTFASPEHQRYAASVARVNLAKLLEDALASHTGDPKRAREAIERVATAGGPADLAILYRSLFSRKRSDPDVIASMLGGLERAARERGVIPKDNLSRIGRLLQHKDPRVVTAAVRLAGAWKQDKQSRQIQGILKSDKSDRDLQRRATIALGEIGGEKNRAVLEKLASSAKDSNARASAVLGLAALDVKIAARHAATLLETIPWTRRRPQSIVSAFTSREGGADALAEALRGHKVGTYVTLEIAQHLRETGETTAALIAAFQPKQQKPLAERLLEENLRALAADVVKRGDPARGEKIFRRRSLACMSCHGIGGAGPTLGPDLGAIGSATQAEYIVDSILRPNKAIAQQFASVAVTTKSGQVLAGTLRYNGKTEVVIRSAAQQGRETTVPKSNVKTITPLPSLMPPGLANGLKDRQEFLDLANFLHQLGRDGPYRVSVKPIFRRWQYGEVGVRTSKVAGKVIRYRDNKEMTIKEVKNDLRWASVYSMVNGNLPEEAIMPPPVPKSPLFYYRFVRGHIDVSRAGLLQVKVTTYPAAKTSFWIDDDWISDPAKPVMLRAGRRSITFMFKCCGNYGLHVELEDVPGSTARYKIVNGP